MPKGRGSNFRRNSYRQKLARFVARLPVDHPFAVWVDDRRTENMWGKRNPENFVRGKHSLQKQKEKRPSRLKRMKAQNKRAAEKVAANAERRRKQNGPD